MAAPEYVIEADRPSLRDDAIRELTDNGFCVIRGLFTPAMIESVVLRIEEYARNPALAGVPGYCKVDHPKRLISPYTIGGSAVEMILNEQVIDIVEAHQKSECVLAETNIKIDEPTPYVYFPVHSDFEVGWTKGTNSNFRLTKEHMNDPIGIGGAIYLHDTTQGSFSYCAGTHKLSTHRGANLTQYPKDERKAIMDKYVKIDGLAGDFVLFDDRGFHGPDQPSYARRSVILVDYYRVETFGRTIVSPAAVWSSDIGRLSDKQLRVLGVGADYMVPPEQYMSTRFRRNGMYSVVRFLVENAYRWNDFKGRIRHQLKRQTR